MFSCVLSCEEETALSIIDPTSALVELNNSRRQKGRKNAGLLDITEEQLPSLEVSSHLCFQNLNFFTKEILILLMKLFRKFSLVVTRALSSNLVEDKGCLTPALGLNLDAYQILCLGFGGFP